jgi:hypothetical protein
MTVVLQALYILYESASGYALFNVTALDEIGQNAAAVQDSVTELTRFSKVVHLEAFKPFTSAADALEQINAVSEGEGVPRKFQDLCQLIERWGTLGCRPRQEALQDRFG